MRREMEGRQKGERNNGMKTGRERETGKRKRKEGREKEQKKVGRKGRQPAVPVSDCIVHGTLRDL